MPLAGGDLTELKPSSAWPSRGLSRSRRSSSPRMPRWMSLEEWIGPTGWRLSYSRWSSSLWRTARTGERIAPSTSARCCPSLPLSAKRRTYGKAASSPTRTSWATTRQSRTRDGRILISRCRVIRSWWRTFHNYDAGLSHPGSGGPG